MRHNTGTKCDIILFVICISILAGPVLLYSKNEKPTQGKTRAVVKENNEKGTQPRESNTEDSGTSDKNERKDQTGLPLKEYKDEDFKPVVEEESYGWLIVKTIFILGTIVGIFYYFLRYVTKKAGIQVLGTDAIHVLSMVPIGQNKYLQIIDLAGKVFVLGVSENNINLITEIKDKSEIDHIRLLSSKSSHTAGKTFQESLVKHISGIFERFTDRKKRSSSEKDDHDDRKNQSFSDSEFDLNYLKRQRHRLKNLNGHDE